MDNFQQQPPLPATSRSLCRRLAEARARERSGERSETTPQQWADLQMQKWDIIGNLLRVSPFTVTPDIARSDQWRRVRDHLKTSLNEPEITDWLIQQIEVAANLAAGIHEMRPRRSGPCYDIVMEWVANRQRKTQAVVKWMKGDSTADFPTFASRPLAPQGKDQEG
jgi:hypothetical protein